MDKFLSKAELDIVPNHILQFPGGFAPSRQQLQLCNLIFNYEKLAITQKTIISLENIVESDETMV